MQVTEPPLTETGFEWLSTRVRIPVVALLGLIAWAVFLGRSDSVTKSLLGVVLCLFATCSAALLAINAAIESAAAGEFGRRFAVVASQVKELADESKEATRPVKSIVGEIQAATGSLVLATEDATKEADVGSQLAARAGGAIDEIVAMIHTITLATQQQRTAFHYLNPALATSSRLFNELNRDDGLLTRFLNDSANTVRTFHILKLTGSELNIRNGNDEMYLVK